eukprot:COSAG01_NODE_5896_length_3965_cov_2.419296_5_plen_52_part_00
MAANAAGELLAKHVLGEELPDYADGFEPKRYAEASHAQTMRAIFENGDGGI